MWEGIVRFSLTQEYPASCSPSPIGLSSFCNRSSYNISSRASPFLSRGSTKATAAHSWLPARGRSVQFQTSNHEASTADSVSQSTEKELPPLAWHTLPEMSCWLPAGTHKNSTQGTLVSRARVDKSTFQCCIITCKPRHKSQPFLCLLLQNFLFRKIRQMLRPEKPDQSLRERGMGMNTCGLHSALPALPVTEVTDVASAGDWCEGAYNFLVHFLSFLFFFAIISFNTKGFFKARHRLKAMRLIVGAIEKGWMQE